MDAKKEMIDRLSKEDPLAIAEKITGTSYSGYGFKIGDKVTYKGSKWVGVVSSIDRRDEPKPIAVIWSHSRDKSINYNPKHLIKIK